MKRSATRGKAPKSAPFRSYTLMLSEIPVTVTEKVMKTLRLRITPDLSVLLSVPLGTPRDRALRFLSEKEAWVRRVLSELGKAEGERKSDLTDGGEIVLWGVRYPLTVKACGRRSALTLSGEAALLTLAENAREDARERCLHALYKRELEAYLSTALPRLESHSGLVSASHDLRKMKSRWGSCNTKTGHVRLNLLLAAHPRICTDYVVLHELCHLKHPDHGAGFKALLTSLMPDWRAVRALLRGR